MIQSMNALNEKGVQFLLIGLGIWMAMELQYSLSVLIVLPFVLFSPLGGWIADRWCKTRLLQAMVLLQVVAQRVKEAGYRVSNIDVTMIAQKPKLKDYIPAMEQNIAHRLGIDCGKVNVKATTEEHLGFTGDGSGMACHAVCLLEEAE